MVRKRSAEGADEGVRKENWVWLGVGLFTVIIMGIMTGMKIRDGGWGVSLAGLLFCSLCLFVQMYNVAKIVENRATVRTLGKMEEWLREIIEKDKSQEETCDDGRCTESEENRCTGSDPVP